MNTREWSSVSEGHSRPIMEEKMSERVLAIIRIGGRLEENQAPRLITAINAARVYSHVGDIHFRPRTAADLVAARTPAGLLELTDDAAKWGEMPGIVASCKELGLPYRLWSEAVGNSGAEVTTWAPGMERPVVVTGDNNNPDTFLVNGPAVQRVLVLLETGKVDDAVEALKAVLPHVPEMPVFEVVEVEQIVTAPETAHVVG
jgi:hypothetical protein